MRTFASWRIWLMLGIVAIISGCKQPVEIVSPAKDSVSNTAPEFRIRFNNGVPATFTANINGNAVAQTSFTIAGNEAVLKTTDAMLKAGDNVFAVTAPNAVKQNFHLDKVGPVVHVLGGTGTSTRTITGFLTDRGGVGSLKLNGSPVTLDSGKFSVSVPNTTTWNFEATDVYGQVSKDAYTNLGQSFNPAVAARINKQGLDDALPNAIVKIVEQLNFNSYIKNPVSQSCSGALIADACAKLDINNVRLAPGNSVQIQALSGNTLFVKVRLTRLDLSTTATTYARCKSFLCGGDGTIFGTLNFVGTTTVTNTDFAANLAITAANGAVSVRIVDGSLDVDIPFGGLSVDIDFGAVESVPFVGSLLNTVVNGLVNGLLAVITGIVVDIADDFLAGPVSSLINNLISNLLPKSIEFPVANTKLNLGFSPQGFSTSNGGFDLVLANSIGISAVDPAVVQPLGSLFVTGSAPTWPSVTRDGTGVDLTATLSANLINQALTEAYKGGLLNITLNQSNGLTIGTLFGIPNLPIDLDGVTDFAINVKGAVPPAVTINSQANAAAGVANVRLLDLTVSLALDFGDGRGLQQVLSSTVDIQSPFDIGITSDNKLTVGIEGTPEVTVRSFSFQVNGVSLSAGTSTTVANLIQTVTPTLLPKALAAIGGIPIPSIQGFSLQLKDLWNPSSTNNAWISLGGNLVTAAAQTTAAAPVIDAQLQMAAFALFGRVTVDQQRSATISLSGYNPGTDALEYRYRVNSNEWTVWKVRNTITLKMLPAGDNQVEICARTDLLKEDCTTLTVSVPAQQ
jgi:hypothetical protein